jgi:hypothetical protein
VGFTPRHTVWLIVSRGATSTSIYVVQWLRLAVFKGPSRVLICRQKQIHFRKRCVFHLFRIPDDGQSPERQWFWNLLLTNGCWYLDNHIPFIFDIMPIIEGMLRVRWFQNMSQLFKYKMRVTLSIKKWNYNGIMYVQATSWWQEQCLLYFDNLIANSFFCQHKYTAKLRDRKLCYQSAYHTWRI